MSENIAVRNQRPTTSSTKKAEVELTMVLVVFAVLWHVALVITTNLTFGDYLETVRALVGTVLHGRTPVDVGGNARDAWGWPVGVWVGLSVLFLAAYITAWQLWKARGRRKAGTRKPGKKKTGKDTQGLSTAKEMKARISGPEKATLAPPVFVYLGKAISVRAEDTAVIYAPPRSGKSAFIAAGLVVDAPGAVITTSTRPDVLRLTVGARREKGRVYVADFDGLSSYPNKVRWDMVAGCEDSKIAGERSAAMVNAIPREGPPSGAEAYFDDGCRKILQGLLHAAALKPGGTMRDVVAWSMNFSDEEPANIVRESSPDVPLWAGLLDKWCRTNNPDTIGNTETTLGRITGPMMREEVLSMLCPIDGYPGINLNTFTDTPNTLYCLVRESTNASTAPIVTALVESITQAVTYRSGRTTTGRLDTHLSLVLDEAPNTCPLPSLPSLMSEGGGNGIHTWVFAQAPSQVETRWGKEGRHTIEDSAAALAVFGGLKDYEFLSKLSNLIGKEWVQHTSSSTNSGKDGVPGVSTSKQMHLDQKMRPEQIRKLAPRNVLLMYRDLEAIVQVNPWWERPDANRFRTSLAWCLQKEGLTGEQVQDALDEADTAQAEIEEEQREYEAREDEQ